MSKAREWLEAGRGKTSPYWSTFFEAMEELIDRVERLEVNVEGHEREGGDVLRRLEALERQVGTRDYFGPVAHASEPPEGAGGRDVGVVEIRWFARPGGQPMDYVTRMSASEYRDMHRSWRAMEKLRAMPARHGWEGWAFHMDSLVMCAKATDPADAILGTEEK